MPGNLTPAQMYDDTLVVVKGPSLMNRLDFAAPAKAGEAISQGMVMSLDSNGQLVAGCGVGSTFNRPMPLFAIQNINDFDANSDVGNISGGIMSGIVATGGFEIETTAYTSGTYLPNDLLTAATGADLGKVTRCTGSPFGSEVVVGCVSRGVKTNQYGKGVLAFWTTFLPATA